MHIIILKFRMRKKMNEKSRRMFSYILNTRDSNVNSLTFDIRKLCK